MKFNSQRTLWVEGVLPGQDRGDVDKYFISIGLE
jgi:hypothetical protein